MPSIKPKFFLLADPHLLHIACHVCLRFSLHCIITNKYAKAGYRRANYKITLKGTTLTPYILVYCKIVMQIQIKHSNKIRKCYYVAILLTLPSTIKVSGKIRVLTRCSNASQHGS